MKVRKEALRLMVAGALLAMSGASFAQESVQAEAALVKSYTEFAGTQGNAISLVSGLRAGTEVNLGAAGAGCAPTPPPVVTPPPPTPPSPPTGGMPGGSFTPPPPPPPSGFTPPPPPAPPVIQPASFTPPTGNMGYGNVDIALNLAQQQLAKAGFTQPTPTQIRASLMGGQVSTCGGVKTDLQGILVLRANSKDGWGRIASKLGLVLKE